MICEPLISIIVPVYNVEPYLRRCLDSIVSQTYKNLDIIIIDDGSSDGSEDICDQYSARDRRIRVVRQKNAGLSAARNVGLDIAKGEYVQFVDSDDWIELTTCETILSIANEKQADIVCFGYDEFFPSGVIKNWCIDSFGEIEKTKIMRELASETGNIRDYVWNKLYHRRLFGGIRFPIGRCYEDMDVSYRLFHEANNIYGTNKIVYHYLRRKGSLAHNRYSPNSIKDRLYIRKRRFEFMLKYYPSFADFQLINLLKEMMIGISELKGESDYKDFIMDMDSFVSQYRELIKALTKSSKMIWLFYYCRPLSQYYAKWHFVKNYNSGI